MLLNLLTNFWTIFLAVDHLIVLALASSHVVLTKRDSRSAIGWVGVIWLAPFLGAALYVMFGVNRIQRRAQKLDRTPAGDYLANQVPNLEPASAAAFVRTVGEEGSHLENLWSYVGKVTGLGLLDGNRVRVLKDGDLAYGAMLAAIAGAETSISLSTYIFDNDELGRQFVEALRQAKERGVAVRVLIDDVGTRYSWPSIKRWLSAAGVPFATFLPTLVPWQLHYTNLRNHRKILVVDGRLGFTGGMNIRQGHRATNPGKYPIQDLHFELSGPVLAHLQETFAIDWEFCTGERLAGPEWFPVVDPQGFLLARGIADGPDVHSDRIRVAILGALACAKKSVTIISPYFLPEQPLISALGVAAMRGVEVTILLPAKNNLRLVQWASTAQLWQVLERGCKVFLTPPPFDHTKLMLVDGVWSLVGSANWDPRSLRLNFEFNVECYDQALATELQTLVQEKLGLSRELTLADVDARPLWMRLRDGFARLALPYL